MTSPLEPRTRIKICGLTREQDVDAAVAAGADAIGLVLYPKSPRFVAPERAAELARRLPPFVTPVLLFVNAPAAEVRAACALLPHAMLQFHGDETPAQCAEAAGPGRPWLRAARIPCAPVHDLAAALADPQVHARAMIVEVPDGHGGTVRMPGNPIKLSDTHEDSFTAPPRLGEHTAEVLRALAGIDAAELAALRAAEVV